MFHNKGHYLSFKSSVEGIAVPDGWKAIRTDTLRIKNSPRLFTASLIIPFKYGTEAMLEFECVIKSVANLGSEVEYVRAWKADTTGPGEYFVCAQYSIQKSPSETKILLFAEEEDHQLLEKTIIAIIDQFKIINQDFSQLTKQPPEWDLNQLKPPKDITNNK